MNDVANNNDKTNPMNKMGVLYLTVSLIAFIVAFSPIPLLLAYSGSIQQKISGVEEILFFYGLSNTLPAIIEIFGSMIFGGALAFIIIFIPYIYLPGFKEYEKSTFRKTIQRWNELE